MPQSNLQYKHKPRSVRAEYRLYSKNVYSVGGATAQIICQFLKSPFEHCVMMKLYPTWTVHMVAPPIQFFVVAVRTCFDDFVMRIASASQYSSMHQMDEPLH